MIVNRTMKKINFGCYRPPIKSIEKNPMKSTIKRRVISF